MKLMVIWGSSRAARKGGPVAEWISKTATADGRFMVDFVDLRKFNLPFLDVPKNPFEIASLDEYSDLIARAWAERVAAADGFIIVTPEYNHGVLGVLKNALDWVGKPWVNKPVGIVGYGGIVGGARAVELLKPTLLELGLLPQNTLHFPYFEEAFDAQGQPKRLDYYQANFKKMLDKLAELYSRFQKIN